MSVDYVVAVDGGGSKTDAVAIAIDGTVLGRAQGPGSSPHIVGLDASVAIMNSLISAVVGESPPVHCGIYLSGLDLQQEIDDYRTAVSAFEWSTASLSVDNDLFALLRSGTSAADAVAVVCGTGINAIGMRRDGATARFLALGPVSGDWGGATGLGEEALWHAARDEDRRGPATSLTAAIRDAMKVPTIRALSEAIHLGVVAGTELGTLSPLIFEHAKSGDVVSGSLVDRQAEEIALMALSCLRRLDLAAEAVPVVLGGGVIRGRDPRLLSGISSRIADHAPLATTVIVDAPPLLGAALLALESAGGNERALTRAAEALND